MRCGRTDILRHLRSGTNVQAPSFLLPGAAKAGPSGCSAFCHKVAAFSRSILSFSSSYLPCRAGGDHEGLLAVQISCIAQRGENWVWGSFGDPTGAIFDLRQCHLVLSYGFSLFISLLSVITTESLEKSLSVIVRDVLWYHASNVLLFHKVLMPSVNLLVTTAV